MSNWWANSPPRTRMRNAPGVSIHLHRALHHADHIFETALSQFVHIRAHSWYWDGMHGCSQEDRFWKPLHSRRFSSIVIPYTGAHVSESTSDSGLGQLTRPEQYLLAYPENTSFHAIHLNPQTSMIFRWNLQMMKMHCHENPRCSFLESFT